jgi:hypothetical protein
MDYFALKSGAERFLAIVGQTNGAACSHSIRKADE